MDPEQLRETIAAAKAGREDGYRGLLSAYGPRLYGYFLKATGNSHDAEDLLSDLTLRLVRVLSRYDERGRFEPWLFRIAANMVRDRIRRRKANPSPASLSAEGDGGKPLIDRLPDADAPVDAGLLAEEAGEQLRAALDELDERTREMILLRHYGELSFKEIAAAFDCPLGTALARVHRGLKSLRRRMGATHASE